MTRSAARRIDAARILLILATVCVTTVGLVGSASANGGTAYVQPGQSIQTAIDRAHPGDRIIVRAGTYAEQLTVGKNGIQLVGRGAVLIPPPSPVLNTCSGLAGEGTEAGICVTGKGVVLAPFDTVQKEHRKFVSVGTQVKDVWINGFQVRGFSGENIAVVGARNTLVTGNSLADGTRYGFLTVGSKNTRAGFNTVTSAATLRFIGICMDDLGGAVVTSNHISGYQVALCVQTARAEIRNNDVSASCTGIFVDPGIVGAKIRRNHIGGTNPDCGPPNAGIVLFGAVNTDVRGNHIEGQTVPGGAAGVAVVDVSASGPFASGNVVTHNVLHNNDLDLFVSSVGIGNVLKRNECATSDPHGLCTPN